MYVAAAQEIGVGLTASRATLRFPTLAHIRYCRLATLLLCNLNQSPLRLRVPSRRGRILRQPNEIFRFSLRLKAIELFVLLRITVQNACNNSIGAGRILWADISIAAYRANIDAHA